METRKTWEIKKGVRHRKAMGDIDGLVASIETIGLLHPVVINKDNELIAGARRIFAFKLLRREDIPVTVIDIDSAEIVLGENAENEHRKGFTVSERVAIGREVERVLGERRGRDNPRNVAELKGKETRQVAAEKSGFGNPESYRQAKAVVVAAEAEPEKYGKLAEEMDATGKVQPAHKQLKASKKVSPAVKANRNFAPPDTRAPTDASKYADIAEHRATFDQFEAFLKVFGTLEARGDAAQVAEAILQLNVNEDTVTRLVRIAAFATKVASIMGSKSKSIAAE